MNDSYDIAKAFERIEDILVSSMKRNLTGHLTEEQLNQLTYSQWQALQLDAMRQFRLENPKLFQKEFDKINKEVERQIKETYNTSATTTENKILRQYVGQKPRLTKAEREELYKLHNDKLKALINATTDNMTKAEYAILRTANDVYRKVIFDSQVYLNTGSGTLSQAIDMATKDFLSQGLNCIQYKNGAMVNIASYSEMALRTANTRAGLQGDAYKRDEWNEPLVMITFRSSACPHCVRYIGKVFYDDVWGTIPPTSKNKYPLLSSAIAGGLYHPNCKDTHTTYFEGITQIRIMTKDEEKEAVRRYNLQQEQRYNERQIRKYKRLEEGSITDENKTKYGKLRKQWQNKNREFVKANYDVLRRDYRREQVKISGDLVAPKLAPKPDRKVFEFIPATNRSEAYKMLGDNSIQYDTKKLDNMNEEYLVKSTNQLSRLKSQYSKTNSYEVTTMNRKGGTIATNGITIDDMNHNTITFNLKYDSDEYVAKVVRSNVDVGHFMPVKKGMESEYILTHEFGHSLSNEIANTMLATQQYQDKILQEFETLKIQYKHSTQPNLDDILKKNATIQIFNDISYDIANEIRQIFDKMFPNEKIGKYVSKYGKSDDAEFFAELFANAVLGEPNKAGEAMIEFLKQKGYGVQ